MQYIKQQFKYAYSSTVNTLTALQWLAFEPYQTCMSANINAYIINMHAWMSPLMSFVCLALASDLITVY